MRLSLLPRCLSNMMTADKNCKKTTVVLASRNKGKLKELSRLLAELLGDVDPDLEIELMATPVIETVICKK